MTTLAEKHETHSASLGPVVACVNRIRRRLFTVRLFEAAITALLLAGITGIFILAARLLIERYPTLSVIVALVPMFVIAWAKLRHHYWIYRLPRFPRILLAMAAILLTAHTALLFWPAYLLAPIWAPPAGVAVWLVLVALFRTRKATLRQAAIFVDQQAGLREQVSTALEWANSKPASELEAAFREPLLAAAIQACTTVHRAKVGYARLNRQAYGLMLLALLVVTGMTFVTPLQAIARKSDKPNQTVVRQATKLIEKIADLEKVKPEQTKSDDTALEPLKAAITDLKRGQMSNLEAMTRLAEAREDMQKELDKQNAAQKAADAMDKNPVGQSLAEKAEQLREALSKTGDPQAAQQAAKALDDAVKELGDKLAAGQMSASEKKQLGDAIKAAAGAAAGDPQLKQSLDNAGKALAGGDAKKFSEAMADAGKRMGEKMGQNKLSGEALSEAIRAADAAARELGNNNNNNGDTGSDGQMANSGDQGQNGQDGQNSQNGSGGENKNGEGNQASASEGGQPGGGQQPGQSGQSGGAQGESASAMAGSGNGQGDSKSNNGSTNWEQKGGPGDQYHGRDVGKESKFVKIYGENPIANRGKAEQAGARVDGRGTSAGSQDTLRLADKAQSTIVDFGAQVRAAGKDAEEQLSRQQIPAQYRDVIRQYYDSK